MKQTDLLSNKTILVTRPAGREKHLCQLIKQAGGNVIHYPVINIQPPSDIEQLKLLRDCLPDFTMAIFISPTAVEQSQIYFPALPEHLKVVSIGSKTSRKLEAQNIAVDIEAPEHNTESLLNTSAFQIPEIQGQRILIFRGSGGRALLGDTLIKRGAQVQYVETYRRELPPQQPLNRQQLHSLDAITISSNEGLDNLLTLIKDSSLLIETPLIVPSERAISLAREYGFKIILAAKNATDGEIFNALSSYFSTT